MVMHLLGRWENSQIVFPLPSRNDFYVKQSSEKYPYIVINQFFLCNEHSTKVHFPKANSSLYPDTLNHDEQPPIYHEDLVSTLREDHLLNWNLNDATAPLIHDLGEDSSIRVRRQAGSSRSEKLLKIKSELGPNDSFASAYFYNTKINKTFVSSYAKLCKNLLSDINKTLVIQTGERFSHVWPTKSNLAFVAILVDLDHAAGDFVISIVIPPYCTLAFNDCSIMQALGFDSVGQPDDPVSIMRRSTNDALPWNWINNTGTRRVVKGKRPIPNAKMSSLRIKARSVREKMTSNVRGMTPEIVKDVVLGTDDSFTISLEFTGNVKSPPVLTTKWPENFDVLMSEGGNIDEQLDATKKFFNSLLDHLCTFYGFHNGFYRLLTEPTNKRLIMTYSLLHDHSTKDQLTVEFVLGQKAYDYFLTKSGLDNPLVWNYGVQSPLAIIIKTDTTPIADSVVEINPPNMTADLPKMDTEKISEAEQPSPDITQPTLVEIPVSATIDLNEGEKALIEAIEAEEAVQRSDEELIELKRKNALIEEQARRDKTQKLINLTHSLSEKRKLFQTEVERQKQIINDVEAEYQQDLIKKRENTTMESRKFWMIKKNWRIRQESFWQINKKFGRRNKQN